MANLVKFNCVTREEGQRVIDSDEIIAEKLRVLSNVEDYVEGEGYDNEFSENLTTDRVERLLEDRDEVSLKRAMEEKEKIILDAKAEANYIIESARKEAESMKIQIFARSEKEGYEEGFDKGMKQVSNMEKDLREKKKALESDYQKKVEELEPLMVDALIDIFENAFSIQFAEKKDFIIHLLQSAFCKIENSKDYLIRVSREDYPMVQDNKDAIREELPRSATVEVVEDLTLVKNQCLIETDGGVFDCSLDTQMDNLIRDLRMLSSM